MSTGSLISKYLPVEAQLRLLSDLVDESKFSEILDIIDATSIDLNNETKLLNNLFSKFEYVLRKEFDEIKFSVNTSKNPFTELIENTDISLLSKLTCKIPGLWQYFELFIMNRLYTYISSFKGRLFEEQFFRSTVQPFIKIDQNIDVNSNVDEMEINMLLTLLETMFLSDEENIPCVHADLDRILVSFLGCNIESISVTSAKLMRWRFKEISATCRSEPEFDSFTWNCIKFIYSERDFYDWKERNCLTFVLRIIANTELSNQLIQFIQTEQYWQKLQDALNRDIHEHRKLALSVLRTSVQKLPNGVEKFECKSFIWNPTETEKILNVWKKFTTLYEIVALDTALNQMQAAKNDIVGLFDEPLLYPAWSLILFSTGLKASMESVRKYTMSLIFDVKNGSVFSKNLDTLTDTILTSAMQAHYYKCTDTTCAHGEKVSNFVFNVLSGGGNMVQSIIEKILVLLIREGSSFEPSRIYISLGILNYLESGSHTHVINANHLMHIRKLFEFESEEEIFERTTQSILLRFLLHIDNSVVANDWIDTIASHLRCSNNNFGHFKLIIENLKEIAKTRFELASEVIYNDDPKIELVCALLFSHTKPFPTKEFLNEVAKCGYNVAQFRDPIDSLLHNLIENPHNDEDYMYGIALARYAKVSNEKLNNTDILSTLISNFSIHKFLFFSQLLKCNDDSMNPLIDVDHFNIFHLYDIINESVSKLGHEEFKLKDSVYGAYFRLVTTFWNDKTNKRELNTLLDIMMKNVCKDNGYYSGNLSVTQLIHKILDGLTTKECDPDILKSAFNILSSIWDNISGQRLVLKERSLHIEIIDTMFHSSILSYASDQEELDDVCYELATYGENICSLGFSRRGFLPLLTKKILKFITEKPLTNSNANYSWLIRVIVAAFTQPRMEVSIFKLKTVIASIYDDKFNTNDTGVYEEIYGEKEIAANVHIINAIPLTTDIVKNQLIQYIVDKTNLLIAKKRIDGPEEAERLLEWQIILLAVHSQKSEYLNEKMFDSILKSIELEASPLIRVYKEWFIAYSIVQNYNNGNPSEAEKYIISLLEDHSKPVSVVSAEKICFLTLKALLEKKIDISRLFNQYLCNLIPNSTSNKPLVRHFSNSLMLSFWPVFKDNIKDAELKSILENLFLNAKKTQIIGQYRAGDANIWDLYADLTLTNIFGGVLRKITDHRVAYIPKAVYMKYLLNATKFDTDIFCIGEDETNLWLDKRGTNDEYDANKFENNNSIEASPLQTKSGAWETVMDIDNDRSNDVVKRSDLIVVSSLVDKPPNLGGICRLCDVLGVGLLTVQDIRVKNHPQFKNVAVTADKWMPMEEVPVDSIIEFMRKKKKENYTLIGLEQTDKSVKLDNNYQFPRKSLVLLGTEAHGIPGYLLSELDLCLEIQQHGVIRSMNIQTATAVIVHSYTVQHM